MKAKYIGALFTTALALLTACDDTTNTLGMSMLDKSDWMGADTKTYQVTTRSYLVDSVYAKTSTGYVGRFTDPEFGSYTASFLTELNCTDNFKFEDILPDVYEEYIENDTLKGKGTLVDETVRGVRLIVYYSTWFGDSLNACRMSAYELNNQWAQERKDENRRYRYTDINTDLYKGVLLGRKAYTAYDATVPDSIRTATDSNGNATYSPSIVFNLDTEIGQKIYDENKNHPEYFKNADAFIENVFPGVCIQNDYGDGTILYVDRVDMEFQFQFHYVDSLGVKLTKKVNDASGSIGDDSTYIGRQTIFASTKEVIQANHFENSDKLKEKAAEKGWTYIKSPAGIFTEATLPYDEIYEELANDTLNAVKLTFTNYNEKNNYKFSMDVPGSVLLLRKQDLSTFFEENQVNDNITSFTASHNNVATNQYTFQNIARLVSTCINEKKAARNAARQSAGANWDEATWNEEWNAQHPDWNKVLLIPVSITTQSTSSTSSSSTTTAVQHDLQPGYAKLQGGDPENGGTQLTLEVTYTSFAQ